MTMAAGDKPRFSITARRKDAERGSKERTKIGAAWEGRFPGTHDASFREVKEMVMQDGTVIDPNDYFFDIKDWSIDDRGGRGASGGHGERQEQRTQPGNGTPAGFIDGSGTEPPF